MVEPTHLKNLLVKLDHFRIRVETNKEIVKTRRETDFLLVFLEEWGVDFI